MVAMWLVGRSRGVRWMTVIGGFSTGAALVVVLFVAALNEQMLRLAGSIADGVLLNYLPASRVPWCVERVREGGDAPLAAGLQLEQAVGAVLYGTDDAREGIAAFTEKRRPDYKGR